VPAVPACAPLKKPGKMTNKDRPSLRKLITGRFLTSPRWAAQWPFLVYLGVLGMVMIASSHAAERKVYRIAELQEQVKELSSEYISLHTRLMNERMESRIARRAKKMGLQEPVSPPVIIKPRSPKKDAAHD